MCERFIVNQHSSIYDTLEQAKNYENCEIFIEEGSYILDQTVVIDESFSGEIKIYSKNNASFSSFQKLSGWKKEGDYFVADYNGDADIKTLYIGENRLPVACSQGFIPKENSSIKDPRYAVEIPKDMANMENLTENAYLKIIPSHPWVLNILDIKKIENNILTTRQAATYPMRKCHNFIDTMSVCAWIENAKEFLTENTWCFDRKNKKIYVRISEKELDNVYYPTLLELFRIEKDHVTLKGITFKGAERYTIEDNLKYAQHEWEVADFGNALVRFRNAKNCKVAHCNFQNSSSGGLRFDLACENNLIFKNEFSHLGGTGIFLGGYGAGTKNVNKNNIIQENHIHHIGGIYHQSMGIYAWHSSNNHIYRNKVHHTGYIGIVVGGSRPCMFKGTFEKTQFAGIREIASADRETLGSKEKWIEIVDGKDKFKNYTDYFVNLVTNMIPYQHTENNLIEENEIYHCVQKMSDGNGIYLSDTSLNNIVRGNYVHDMDGKGGQQAIRTDEFMIGTTIENNIIYKCNAGGINIKHYNNHARNNLIFDIKTVKDIDINGIEQNLYFGYFSLVCVLDSYDLPDDQKISIKDNIFIMVDENQTFYRVGNSDGGVLEEQISGGKLDQCIVEGNTYYSYTNQEQQKAFIDMLISKDYEKGARFLNPIISIKNGQVVLDENCPLENVPQIAKL